MDKKDGNLIHELKKIGLIRVFSNLDTQSAIVAAFVISLVTVVTTVFVNLCNYIYWSAYFSRFNIPLAYMEEAIIPENGTKYILILFVPIIIFVWLMLDEFFAFVKKIINKLKTNNLLGFNNRQKFDSLFSKLNIITKRSLGFFVVAISFMFFLALWTLIVEMTSLDGKWLGMNIIFLEIALFFMLKISKVCFGKFFSFSQKNYIVIRVVGLLLVLYMILAEVYIAGNFENYSNGEQQIKIINNYELDYSNLKHDTEYEVNIVLLETVDYYYVTDATMKIEDNSYYFTIWDDDTYKFIEKKENPIKTIYGVLWNPRQRANNSLDPNMDSYFFCVLGVILVYICILSIPAKTINQKE